MARTIKTLGPSRLTKLLTQLRAEPKYTLPGLKSLKLTYAFRNDHFGARHFVKDSLPKIRYDNPNLKIEVEKPFKGKDEHWKPEMELLFESGQRQTLSLSSKWSTVILKELLDLSGGEPWRKWKRDAVAKGLPLVPGEENESSSSELVDGEGEVPAQGKEKKKGVEEDNLPSYKVFRAANPVQAKPVTSTRTTTKKDGKQEVKKEGTTGKKVKGGKVEPQVVEELVLDSSKTGAAAVLP